MAEIAWWAWLGVGLFVSVTSAVVGGKTGLFLWVGLLFVVVGMGKVVFLFVLKERETKAEKTVTQHEHVCPYCRGSIKVSDRFCRSCGTRLR